MGAWSVDTPDVRGTYRVVQSFRDGFIGEILIKNTAGSDRAWTVRLDFPAGVGELRNQWLEGQPQPVFTQVDGEFVWRSTVDVRPGSTVSLRFQFGRVNAAPVPSVCTVNDAPCAFP
ncbi:hypothetical protein Val02_36240 [Virgisporangium aliadipatigenens]|uniref:CBM2 domain-containing protein n=1 Tax=Virgisporangium aliadipatigenens TaxID=741659 RepID=A0A8J4DRF7_9ACTN|nr:cellulose binding domain-containing protein [Virgisporangium aliadipatigenens]GIJ46738.1 hypothetical protein Val02_36240 [Virgisporangium aliadipatigenens]